MALIEVYHVVAANWPIDSVNATDIPQGSIIGLDANGEVVFADSDTGAILPMAIAGDSRSTGTSYTPESGSALTRDPVNQTDGALVLGSYGTGARRTQNRVADYGNEVLASDKMTAYHSGGEFWTDQYELVRANGTTVCTYTPGSLLYVSGSAETPATNDTARAGRFTDELNTGYLCAQTVTSPTAYPSGVPGTDVGFTALPEGGNSLSYGTFLHLKLLV